MFDMSKVKIEIYYLLCDYLRRLRERAGIQTIMLSCRLRIYRLSIVQPFSGIIIAYYAKLLTKKMYRVRILIRLKNVYVLSILGSPTTSLLKIV